LYYLKLEYTITITPDNAGDASIKKDFEKLAMRFRPDPKDPKPYL